MIIIYSRKSERIVIGDILFFKKSNNFISNAIASITKSDYTHVGIIIAYDQMSQVATIIESDRFIRTKISRVQLNESHSIFAVENMTDEQRELVLKYAHSKIGTEYDYVQILGLFFSLIFKGERRPIFNSTNKIICSELIDLSYVKAGIKRNNADNIGNVTPQELFEVYRLYEFKFLGKEM